MRFSLKRLTYVAVASLGLALLYFTIFLHHDTLVSFYMDLKVHDRFDQASFKKADHILREQFHYTNYLFEDYDGFTRLYQNEAQLKTTPINEKCKAFFEYFDGLHPDWEFNSWRGDFNFDKNVVHKYEYFKSKIKILKDDRSSRGEPDSDTITFRDNVTINEEFKESIRKTKIAEQGMADTATILRLYGKCFLNNKDHGMDDLYQKFSNKLFPFLNRFSIPTYERLSSEGDRLLDSNKFPIHDSNNQYGGKFHVYDSDKDNIIEFLHKKSSGRGIVVSATNSHVEDLIRLIRVLRALNNRLPIQIVYKGDINTRSRSRLELIANEDINYLLHPGMAPEHLDVLPELNLLEQYKDYGSEFPPQDIWLVNIKNCVEKNQESAFPKYSNKLLALLMNSFEEVLLLDADTVPLVPINKFFESDEYKKSKTFFFKDRSLRDFNDYIETNYFTKLFPVNQMSIDTLFDIPLVSEKTLGNKYLTGWRHFQEAGIVAISKVDHFLPILMTLPLNLWKDPVISSIWGDKEMYWLGFAMAGDENYEFNEFSAASVGELTKNNNHTHYPNGQSSELCSTHPGHVDKSGKLLWINSGFSYCKKNSYFRDRVRFPFTTFSTEDLREQYAQPLRIRAAIIPPDLPNLRNSGEYDNTHELAFKESWAHRKPDTDEDSDRQRIEEYGPQKGWIKNAICSGYYYCAYNKIDTYNSSSQSGYDEGRVFEFSDEEAKLYDYLGKIWITGNTRTEPKKIKTQVQTSTTSTSTAPVIAVTLTSSASSNEIVATTQSLRSETNTPIASSIESTGTEEPTVIQQESFSDARERPTAEQAPSIPIQEKTESTFKEKFTDLLSKLDKPNIPKEQQLSKSGTDLLSQIIGDIVQTPSRSKQYEKIDQDDREV